ncbi:MAG: glycosyltransferase, partial [Gammaproteobacteria bacterium]|nr:glycosyltransferase [Gammaproteobacteria bacterium]
ATLMRLAGADCSHSIVALDGRTDAAALAAGVQLEFPRFNPARGPVATARGLRALLMRENPDLLLSYNWGAIDAAIAARSLGWRRLVHHEDGFNLDEAHRLKARRNWLRRLVLAPYDVVVPSSGLLEIAEKTWHLSRVHFIANGINADSFSCEPALGAAFRVQHGIAPDAVVVGAVGHLRPVKNYQRLLRVVAAVNAPLKLVFVGDGAERQDLERLAATLGVNPCFTGHIDDLRGAYSAFDVLAISSDSEQQPVSLLEAMAAGLSVCSTDVGDVRATLPAGGEGFLVPLGPSVETELAGVLEKLVGDSALRARLGAANREHVVDNYTEAAMQAAYARVYEAALRR